MGKGRGSGRERERGLPGTPELWCFGAFFAVADEEGHAKRSVGCVADRKGESGGL